MSKRHAARVRQGPWIYLVFVVVLYVLGSFVYAWSTEDTACGVYNQQKEWRYVPPGWDCPSSPF